MIGTAIGLSGMPCVRTGGVAMEIKTEACSYDMTEYPRYDPHDDRPTTGMFGSGMFGTFWCIIIHRILPFYDIQYGRLSALERNT